MAIEVYIPTPYRRFTDNAAQVHVDAEEAPTVGRFLQVLAQRYPGIGERILAEDGSVPGHLSIYVNEVEIRSLQGTETPLHDGDEVALIPAMAGGSGAAGAAATAGPLLDEEQMERYSRQVILEQVGVAGQRKLLDASVLIIGAGALGSPNAVYLAAAGVGTIGLVDGDRVDRSNLHRQILHFSHDVGRPKTQSARRHIEDINPRTRVVEHPIMLTSENALDVIRPYDLVINGSDNFPTRYLVNDACVFLGKPLIDASILKFEGQATVYLPGRGCYRCLFPAPPPPGSVPSCAEGGILGAVAGHMGSLQAIEAIKVLLGIGDTLSNRLVLFDALSGQYRILRWQRNPACPVCGDHPTITELIDYEQFCGLPSPAPAAATAGAGTAAPAGTAAVARAAAPAFDGSPAAAGAGYATAAGQAAHAARPAQQDGVAGADYQLDPRQAAAWLDDPDVRWFDVREASEFAQGRIPGSEHLDFDELSERLDRIEPDKRSVFVCTVGQRSGIAVQALRQAGYRNTFNLRGGLVAWQNERLPWEP